MFRRSLHVAPVSDLCCALAGHEAPVASIAFSSNDSLLASGSWDHTVILWKIGDEKGARETFDLGHDGMFECLCPLCVKTQLVDVKGVTSS